MLRFSAEMMPLSLNAGGIPQLKTVDTLHVRGERPGGKCAPAARQLGARDWDVWKTGPPQAHVQHTVCLRHPTPRTKLEHTRTPPFNNFDYSTLMTIARSRREGEVGFV